MLSEIFHEIISPLSIVVQCLLSNHTAHVQLHECTSFCFFIFFVSFTSIDSNYLIVLLLISHLFNLPNDAHLFIDQILKNVNVYKQPAETFLLPSGCKCHLWLQITSQQPVFIFSLFFFYLLIIHTVKKRSQN